jgi:hypothetical protein
VSFNETEIDMALTNSLAGRNLGMILLAVWLIITGFLQILSVRISATAMMALAVLAIAAGLLILLRR